MDRETKALAVGLLQQKADGSGATYAEIARQTGYGERQLMRMAGRIAEEGPDAVLRHGNSGRAPSTAASESEREFLREFKKPYESITIAQFRDIFLEDVIENPDRADDVERYGLVARSASWFRDLFVSEGWLSPAARKTSRDADRQPHPIRDPVPRRGQLVQVDATPYDWLGDGDPHALHLAVDDATTEGLAGSFMPTECMRGYARMAKRLVERHGVPDSIYSDKHTVFRPARDPQGKTAFGQMMEDLHVRVIYANSPQAKGRVERYNRTEQLRLVNDIIRFGIRSYEELDAWFNDWYLGYLNAKFSFRPRDPRSAFVPLPEGTDLSRVFRVGQQRVMRAGLFSLDGTDYRAVDADGVVLDPGGKAKVDVYVDAITEEMYVERRGKRYACVAVDVRERDFGAGVGSSKELQQFLAQARRG